ncbi:hypothetical protein, partial [Klebsiella pneumoniae]|uniref:hypothetical protein n=1 Tax=Klebsiella pneumoniae TaxID=573 RepID=UPI0027322A7B
AEQQAQSRAAEQRGATAVEQTPGPLAGEQPAEVEPGIGIKSDGQPFEQQECRAELGELGAQRLAGID